MIKGMYTAASGMSSQQAAIDVVANNLANVNTAGFKRSRTRFQDLLYVTKQQPGAQDANGANMAGIQIGSGTRLLSTTKNFAPGTLTNVDDPTTMAIQGEGFFEVAGPNGERFFTRDGNFNRDVNGDMVTAQGFPMVPGVNIPEGASDLTILRDGSVAYRLNGQVVQAGQLNLVRFVNPAGLSSEGENLYTETPNSGAPAVVIPGQNGAGILLQGMEERSNVDVASELINMIISQRAFEMNSRAISTADSMLNTINQMTR